MKTYTDSGFRTFKSPRLFNLNLSIENWQGDGFVRCTVGLLYRSIQLTIPFVNRSGIEWRWSLFDPMISGAGPVPSRKESE
jgi:hypothetical protein